MKNKKTIQKILIGLVIALVLLVAYAVVTGKSGTANGTSTLSSLQNIGSFGQVQQTDTKLKNAEILKVLGNIKGIELEDDIFLNPVFKTLVDSFFGISKPLRIGRPNPFLPIGFDAILDSNESNSFGQSGKILTQDGDSFTQTPIEFEDKDQVIFEGETSEAEAGNFFGDPAN